MSNGSIAAVALQLKRPVDAIVTLDGGIGENAGSTYLNERSGGDVSALSAPIRHFYARNNLHLNLEHHCSFRSTSRAIVFVRNMRHSDSLAYLAFEFALPDFSDSDFTPDSHIGCNWENRYALHFSAAYLHRSDHAIWFIGTNAETRGVPAGVMTTERPS